MPLIPKVTLQAFDKWAIEFVGPISPLEKRTGERYIIIATDYLTIWVKVKPIKDCSAENTANLIFEYILSRFGCLKILMSTKTYFLNKTIEALTKEFQVYHQKSTPYHPQENGTMEIGF